MQHDSTPPPTDKRPPGPRLLVQVVETFSEDALDRLLACYALMEATVRRRRAAELARKGAGEDGAEAEAETIAPPPAKRRTRRPSPKRLAKWEAQWQAEQDAEGES